MERDEAFARWYRDHHDRIRALCARILRDPVAAEDMAQETLLRAWQRRDSMREADLGAWMSVVARNLCLSAMRKDGRLLFTDELPERADGFADPAIEVGRRESRRNVRRALSKLGDRQRRVIDLREVREADYQEIGSELGLSPEGARAIAFRARRVMREHLAAAGEGFSGILVGIRVRIQALRVRTRGFIGSLDAAAATAMQAGINLALVLGVTIVSLAGTTAGSASKPTVDVAAISVAKRPPAPHTSVATGSADPASKDVVAEGPIHVVAQLPKPQLSGSPYRPGDSSSDLFVGFGPAYVSVPRERGGSPDGLEPAFWALNRSLGLACEVHPQVCEQLEYGFGGE